jgi:hypothetical protein
MRTGVLQFAEDFLHVSWADAMGGRMVIFLTGLAPGANGYGKEELGLMRFLFFPLTMLLQFCKTFHTANC